MNRFYVSISVIACVLIGMKCSATSNDWSTKELTPIDVERTFRVTGVNMCSPEGFIVLIRANGQVAAIKFDNARKGRQKGTGTTHYVAYVRSSDRGDFHSNARQQEGTVSIEGWSGFHPLVIQHGNYRIEVGPFRLIYDFPTCLWFEGSSYEYAPTPWTRIEDVDQKSTHLRWFRYDAKGDLSLEIKPEDLLR
jgi:hypothetical protein